MHVDSFVTPLLNNIVSKFGDTDVVSDDGGWELEVGDVQFC